MMTQTTISARMIALKSLEVAQPTYGAHDRRISVAIELENDF